MSVSPEHTTGIALKTPYHLIISHMSRAVELQAVFSLFANHPSFKGVNVLDEGSMDKERLIEVHFGDEEDARAAAKDFEKRIDWEWNQGFRAKVNGLKILYMRDNVYIRASWDNLGFKNFPDLLGESVGDDLEAIGPGYVFQLPAYNKRKVDIAVDRRLNCS